jgi:hypothetical protein
MKTQPRRGGDVEVEISRVVSPVHLADASIGAQNDVGGGGRSPRASASSRAATFERRPSYHAHRRTEIRGADCFVRPSPGFQALFDGSEPASCSMALPAAIIVEGVPAQLPAAAHMARTDARPRAAAGGGPATRAMSPPRTTSRPFLSDRFSPRVPAPAAPPLPAQRAIRRDRSDESALSPRRSTPPANPALR